MPLYYPLDRQRYLGIIIFTPIIGQPTENAISKATVATAIAQKIDSIADQVNSLINGSENAQTNLGSKPPVDYGESCALYLPQAIQIADGATYNNIDLNFIGGFAETMGPSVMNLDASGAIDQGKAIIDSLRSGGNASALAKVAASSIAEGVSEEVAGAIRSVTRVTANPNTRALFKAVQLRTFVFNFKMIPTSLEEANEIEKIVKFFRKELYPSEINLGRTSVGYNFPNLFQIKMFYQATEKDNGGNAQRVDKEVATKIKPCYLTNFNAVYNSSSMGMHSSGHFSEMEINMTFMEARALNKSDIEEGY